MKSKDCRFAVRSLLGCLAFAIAPFAIGAEADTTQTAVTPEATPLSDSLESAQSPVPEVVGAIAEGDVDEIAQMREQLAGYFEARLLDEALFIAERIVKLARERSGANSVDEAHALTDLANTQYMRRELEKSEIGYLRAIQIFEKELGIFHPALVRARLGLGNIYAAQKRYEEAVDILQDAKYITHRNFGIFNLQQEDIVDSLTVSFLGARDLRGAQREQEFYFRANLRTYGPDNPKVVPALSKLARWHEYRRDYTRAKQLYIQAIEVLEEAYGENDLRLVEPLNELARMHHLRRNYVGTGLRALKRAVDIHANQPFSDNVEYAKAVTRLGDWYILTDKAELALESYRQAESLLESAEVEEGVASEDMNMLDQAAQLRYIPTLPGLDEWEIKRLEGKDLQIVVEFTIGVDGKPLDIEILTEVDGTARGVVAQIKKDVRRARYRPRVVNGEVVPTRIRVQQPLVFNGP